MSNGWIGVDLDGTLAEYYGWNGGIIGKPIPAMVDRVKRWISEGIEVRVFTARVSKANRDETEASAQADKIAQWCKEVFGIALAVTCEKDFLMIDLWDDRCHPVEINTGRDMLDT